MLQLAHVSHPRLLRRTAMGSELVPYRLSHKRTQRDSPFGRCGHLARRKTASGISSVVFMRTASHIYGNLSTLAGKTQQDRSWQRGVTKDEIRFNFSLSGQRSNSPV